MILATPVAPAGWEHRMNGAADHYVALHTPATFFAIGQFYDDFTQVDDEEVTRCLGDAPAPGAISETAGDPPTAASTEVEIPADGVLLHGTLSTPSDPLGVVIFAHGSGSSRLSPRNQSVAAHLGQAGLATLLFDLLSVEEEADRANVFDIDLLAHRLEVVPGATHLFPEPGALEAVSEFAASWFLAHL